MTLHYKTSELTINRQRWVIREFMDRGQFPTAQEKIDIGAASWGSDVPESLWPLSGVLWPSGVALAELVATMNFSGKCILEIGCGVALASMVIHRNGYDVTASDYNSFAQDLLGQNQSLNDLNPIKFEKLSWQDSYVGKPYDVIIGSDVMYEPGCAGALSQFLRTALVDSGEALFVDPGRAHVRKFETTLQRDGFKCDVEWPVVGGKARILRVQHANPGRI